MGMDYVRSEQDMLLDSLHLLSKSRMLVRTISGIAQ